MSFQKTFTTANRVLRQLKHDHRTLGLLFVVPSLLLILTRYVINVPVVFNSFAPMLLGVFPMTMMFLITSITTLRERRSGTLDRLMTMPISKLDFLLGYAVAFSVVAFVQAVITSVVLLYLLDVQVMAGALPTILVAVMAGLLGTALGLLCSAFAATEFQAMQFMPVFLFPQLLLCGIFVAREQMAGILQGISEFLPLTYSVSAINQILKHPGWTQTLTNDLLIISWFTIAALVIGSITIRRQEKP